MTETTKLEKIRNFLNREELVGTDLKLKQKVLDLDKRLSVARAESKQLNEQLQNLNATANNKAVEVAGLVERLDSLCELVIDLETEFEYEPELDE